MELSSKQKTLNSLFKSLLECGEQTLLSLLE